MINGGYLMIDFKHNMLGSSAITLDGIYSKIAEARNKAIYVSNIRSISGDTSLICGFCTLLKVENGYRLMMPGFKGVYTIVISNNDAITAGIVPYSANVNSLNIESEVSTNASKSDSNISK